jgi:outer membrane protein assembly factor BamA
MQFFGGLDNRRYRLLYSTNRLFYTQFSFTAQAYYDLRDYNAFEDVTAPGASSFTRLITQRYRRVVYGGAASAGVYAERFGQLSGTIRAERQSVRSIELRSPGAGSIAEEQAVISLSLGTTIDTQDRWPYPHSGLLFTAAYTSAQRGLGSDIAFTRLEASFDQFIPAGRQRWTLHPRFRFQYGDRTMPKAEEFRLGGMPLFFGMRESEFTGRQLLLGSFELRYQLPVKVLFDSFVSIRYDVGRTWDVPEHITFADLRHGAGIAISLDSPLGPADFGVGQSFLFVHRAAGTDLVRGPMTTYFSIGVELW